MVEPIILEPIPTAAHPVDAGTSIRRNTFSDCFDDGIPAETQTLPLLAPEQIFFSAPRVVGRLVRARPTKVVVENFIVLRRCQTKLVVVDVVPRLKC